MLLYILHAMQLQSIHKKEQKQKKKNPYKL